jgi:hypothetical protein
VTVLGPLGSHFLRLPWSAVAARPEWLHDADIALIHYLGNRSILEGISRLGGWSSAGLRGGAVLALSSPERVDEMEPYLGNGVSRVVSLASTGRSFRDTVAALLAVATRRRIRAPIRLRPASVPGAPPIDGTTENVSSSGILVRCARTFVVGSSVRFELSQSDRRDTVLGSGRVVRATDPERERIDGFAARFETLPDGRWGPFVELLVHNQH